MATALTEPPPRSGHFSTSIGGELYTWGGRTKDFKKGEVTSTVHQFNQKSETWTINSCNGPSPPCSYNGASASAGHHIYMYGGSDGSRPLNSLHQLDTQSWTWSELTKSGPMRKAGCGMIAFDRKLLLFGGYGIPSGLTQLGAKFIKNSNYSDGRGWNNELHLFDLKEGKWSSPTVSGTRPPPCAYLSLTMVDDHNAVLFGGSGQGGVRYNDVYTLDLERMHWTRVDIQVGESCPVVRYSHAAVCLGYGGDHPQLFITGGLDVSRKVLSDSWILDQQSGRWKEVKVPSLLSRCYHSATTFSLSPGLTEITIFGGFPNWPSNFKSDANFPQIANTTVLRFEYHKSSSPGGPPTGEWVLTDVADNTQLGNKDRIRDKGYLIAYRQILATRVLIAMWFIKMILFGPPGLGKSTVRRRMAREIDDINSSGEMQQPSTGAVESGIVIRNLSSTMALVTPSDWCFTRDLAEEANMVLRFISSYYKEREVVIDKIISSPEGKVAEGVLNSQPDVEESPASPMQTAIPDSAKVVSKPSSSIDSKPSQSPVTSEVVEMFRNAIGPKFWENIQPLFEDTAFIKTEDTGGQPEFMDMQAALTIGPALYLLFCKLIDNLHSRYTVSYRSPSGESSTPVQSSYTVEEVILSALASVSCFKSYSTTSQVGSESTSRSGDELLASSNQSVAYILGTHKDLVSEQQIDEFDKKLQESIRSTDFFSKGLVQFASKDRMVLPIDNMHGGKDEIKKVCQFLEEAMKRHFKKLSIPAAWLVFSLCLRKREERTASLQSVLQLAGELGMPEEETKLALWFLHHHAGVLMYFPKLEELKDTVICDTQVVYDSATNLIVDTFRFGSGVGVAASEKFRETGQFSLSDIRKATASVCGDYIPLLKLVKLLEHLNIIAPITPPKPSVSQASSTQSCEVSYFMPCVLQNATREELDKWWESNSNPLSPSPLFIRYKCGFSLIGIFPAMIANLAGNIALQLIVEGIKKNRVQFQMLGGDYDTVTLTSQPKYYAVHITREFTETPTHEVCSAVRGMVESTLRTVTSHMNYSFCAEYELSFECPSHPGRDHLCTVAREDTSPHVMLCQRNGSHRIKMQSQHLVWFRKPLPEDHTRKMTSLNLQPQVYTGQPQESIGVSALCLDPHIPLQPTHPPPHQTNAGDGAVRYPMSTQCPYGPSHMWRAPGNAPGFWGQQFGPSYAIPYQSSVSGIGTYCSQNAPPWGDVSGQSQSGPPHMHSSGACVPSGHAPCADSSQVSVPYGHHQQRQAQYLHSMPPDGGCSSAWPRPHLPRNTATQPMAHPQESYLAHGMSPKGSFSSPQTATQHSVLKQEISHAQLNIIKWRSPSGEEKVLRLKEEMSVKWRELGQNVGVSEAKLAGFRHSHLDPEECVNAVIQAWIEKGSQKYPSNWEGLLELLKDVQLNNLADLILQAVADARSSLHDK